MAAKDAYRYFATQSHGARVCHVPGLSGGNLDVTVAEFEITQLLTIKDLPLDSLGSESSDATRHVVKAGETPAMMSHGYDAHSSQIYYNYRYIYIYTHLILYNKTMQYTLHSQIPKKKWVYEKRHIVCIPVNMHTYMRLFHFVFPVITRSPGRFAWPQRTSRNHRQVWCNCLSLARISHCPFDRIVSNCQYLLYNVHG